MLRESNHQRRNATCGKVHDIIRDIKALEMIESTQMFPDFCPECTGFPFIDCTDQQVLISTNDVLLTRRDKGWKSPFIIDSIKNDQ